MKRGKSKWRLIVAAVVVLLSRPLYADPQDEGSWSEVLDWPLIAIHSILTPQGTVFSFGTDENGVQGAQFIFDVWDPVKGTGSDSHTTLPNTQNVDSFCSAAVLLPESGNMLLAGGDSRINGITNRGIDDALVFETATGVLAPTNNMAAARWYPTATVLGNGEILLIAGRDGTLDGFATTPEIYSPATKQWRSLFGISGDELATLYPRQWVAPDGRVFGYLDTRMYYINPEANGNIQMTGILPFTETTYYWPGVMYRPGKILQLGEIDADTNRAVVIDINGASPTVTPTASPAEPGRYWSDAVVLPTGDVMLVGGSGGDNTLDNISYRPEIWNPDTGEWSLMSNSPTARLYHSTALLLPDGRVLVAGGGAPGPFTNTNAEIFSPPYLFNSAGELADRPAIYRAPSEAPYGEQIAVDYGGGTISRVALIKTGATTHSFDMEQRFMELSFSGGDGTLQIDLPESGNVATPGYYLLFLLNENGVPSVAHTVRISSTAQTENPYPLANNDVYSFVSGATQTLDPLLNDTGTQLQMQAPNPWSLKGGQVALQNNKLRYTPPAEFNGEDKIWYTITDNQGRTNNGEITINISGNGGGYIFPNAVDDVANALSDTTISIDALANDTGTNKVLLAPNAWSLKGGNVALANNSLNYTPKSGFVGEDKIWYVFEDSQGRSDSAAITITVSANPNAQYPVALTDSATTGVNTAVTIDVLVNDTGVGLSLLSANEYSVQGARIVISDNKLIYTPRDGYNGQDSFWYVIRDALGRDNAAQVTVTVN